MAKKEPSRWTVAAKFLGVAPIIVYLAIMAVFIGQETALDLVPGLLGEYRRDKRNARRRARRLDRKLSAQEAIGKLEGW